MTFDPTRLAFIALSAMAVVSAFRVVTAKKLMHAALWLGLTFLMLAGVFLVMGAEFLAAAQVLVYVGAVTTIILFGIMLSEAAELRGRTEAAVAAAESPAFFRRVVLPVVAVVAFVGIMALVYTRTAWPVTVSPAEEDMTRIIGRALFTDFVVPFELAAVLLLVALVGAIVVSVRDDGRKEQG